LPQVRESVEDSLRVDKTVDRLVQIVRGNPHLTSPVKGEEKGESEETEEQSAASDQHKADS